MFIKLRNIKINKIKFGIYKKFTTFEKELEQTIKTKNEMKNKAITLNGQKIIVKFKNEHIQRIIDEADYKTNIHNFIINGNSYIVKSVSKRSKKSGKMNITLIYNGISFPDNEKKVIEFILSK